MKGFPQNNSQSGKSRMIKSARNILLWVTQVHGDERCYGEIIVNSLCVGFKNWIWGFKKSSFWQYFLLGLQEKYGIEIFWGLHLWRKEKKLDDSIMKSGK